MKKIKKVSIIISIIIVLLVLVITYIKTDFLKTKEQLFWKYMLQETSQITQILSSNEIKEYSQSLKNSYYTKQGKISLSSKRNLIKPINVEFTEKGNNFVQISNTELYLKYDNKDLANATIIKDNDYFLVGSKQINAKFLGFENDNLKQIAKNFGLANVDFIPNKIKQIDYYELFSINENEKKHLIKTYIPVLREYVNNKNYSKELGVQLKDDELETNKYILNISEQEFNEVVIELLKTLKEDEQTLQLISKKIKILDDANKYCNIENLKTVINESINELQKKHINKENFLSIILYKNEKGISKVEIILENNRTFVVYVNQSENKITIKQQDIENAQLDLSGFSQIAYTIFNTITEFNYVKNLEGDSKCKVEFNIVCSLGIEQVELNYSCIETIEKQVEGIVEKKDVEYIDLNNVGKDTYNELLNKVFNTFDEDTISNF